MSEKPTAEVETEKAKEAPKKRRFSCLQVLAIVGVAILVTALITAWAVKAYLFPSPFRPVTLSKKETARLEQKLEALEGSGSGLRPEAYSEDGASREIVFSEKEINGLIARESDWADRLAIDLSDNLASAKLLIPLDDDFPFFGGKTVRITAGVELAYVDGRPPAVLKGVSLMGVPVPSAWLGNLKDVDLVQKFGGKKGFWHGFAAGVELIEIRNGKLRLQLKE